MADAKHNDASTAPHSTVSQQVDDGITSIAHALGSTIASGQLIVQDLYAATVAYLDQSKELVAGAREGLKSVEDATVATTKEVLTYAADNPYLAYPALTATALLALPGTRRLLWRLSLGSFVKPEAVVRSCESKVEQLRSRVTDYAAQIQKLEERMVTAEGELDRSYQKLRAARQEFQRLASQVSAGQHTAQGVVRNLRALKQVDSSLAVRGEAASQAAALKAQLSRINKGVWRIASRDI